MKAAYILSILYIILGCTPSEKNIILPRIHETLIFIDKSQSVSFASPSCKSECRQKIDEILRSSFNNTGDRVTVFFIHANTNGAKPVAQQVFTVDKNECTDMTKIEKARCEASCDHQIRKSKQDLFNEIDTAIQVAPHPVTQTGTDIFGILERASEYFQDSLSVKNIYIFSDMIQSTEARKLSGRTLKTKNDALALAKTDKRWIDQNLLVTSKVKGSTICIVTPDTSAYPLTFKDKLRYYWTALFSSFGMTLPAGCF